MRLGAEREQRQPISPKDWKLPCMAVTTWCKVSFINQHHSIMVGFSRRKVKIAAKKHNSSFARVSPYGARSRPPCRQPSSRRIGAAGNSGHIAFHIRKLGAENSRRRGFQIVWDNGGWEGYTLFFDPALSWDLNSPIYLRFTV